MTFNRTHYFIDKGQERGITYESLKLFETDLNTDLKTGLLKVYVVIVPMPRDQLYKALIDGKVDMVAAMVTVTPELEKAWTRAIAPPSTRSWTIAAGELGAASASSMASIASSSRVLRNRERWTVNARCSACSRSA